MIYDDVMNLIMCDLSRFNDQEMRSENRPFFGGRKKRAPNSQSLSIFRSIERKRNHVVMSVRHFCDDEIEGVKS